MAEHLRRQGHISPYQSCLAVPQSMRDLKLRDERRDSKESVRTAAPQPPAHSSAFHARPSQSMSPCAALWISTWNCFRLSLAPAFGTLHASMMADCL